MITRNYIAILTMMVMLMPLAMGRAQFIDIDDYKQPVPRSADRGNGASHEATDISVRVEGNEVEIFWRADPYYRGEFVVLRSISVIDTLEEVVAAVTVARVPASRRNSYRDTVPGSGQYYYAVLAREDVESRKVILKPAGNYTTLPVAVQGNVPGHTDEMKVVPLGENRVLVAWDPMKEKNIRYTVYRSTTVISDPEALKKATEVGTLKDVSQMVDENLTAVGEWYYAVQARDRRGRDLWDLVPGITFTQSPLSMKHDTEERQSPVVARPVPGGVELQWIMPETDSSRSLAGFDIVRGKRILDTPQEIALAEFAGSTESPARKFIDTAAGKDAHFYAIIPRYADGSADIALARYTLQAVSPGEAQSPFMAQSRVRNDRVLISWSAPSGTAGMVQILRWRSGEERPQVVGRVPVESGRFADFHVTEGRWHYSLKVDGIDTPVTAGSVTVGNGDERSMEMSLTAPVREIVTRTFYRKRYDQAITELAALCEGNRDELECAQAQLFIARSYIEKGQYEASLEYLTKDELTSQIPEDAGFWLDYVLLRISNESRQ